MYAYINRSRSISNTLRYHEKKVAAQKAVCIYAGSFLKEPSDMTWRDKLYPFQRLELCNERVKVTTLHLSLNFQTSESISDSQMAQYAKEYMEAMKLSRQPYLVYRHFDSGNPHCHVVCSRIKRDGHKIETNPKFLHHSKSVTQKIEAEHGLLRSGQRQMWDPSHWVAKKVVYGEGNLMPAIDAVLRKVIEQYIFTSLSELNAILRLYNIRATSKGELGYKGLTYNALDEKGHLIGKGIASRLFEIKPTLQNLEVQFALHAAQLQPEMGRLQSNITTSIDWALFSKSMDMEGLARELKKEGISMVLFPDKQGVLQQVYYVDHRNKTVFEGSALGEKYSAAGIARRCPELKEEQKQEVSQVEKLQQSHRISRGLY